MDVFEGQEEDFFDFARGEDEGAFVLGLVDFDEFLAGVGTGFDFAQRGERGTDAEFFFGFADGGGVVAFAGFEVAGGAGVPFGGFAVFPGGAFLQEQFAGLVEDENVDGAVEEVFGVDFGAGAGGYDIVTSVDDVEVFAVMLGGRDGGGVEGAGEVNPLRDGEVFGAGGGREVLFRAPNGPHGGIGLEQRAELFAALAEAALHEGVEEGSADGRELLGRAAFEDDEGGVDAGGGVEDGGREGAVAADGPEALGADGEGAVVGVVVGGGEALGEFVLHGEDGARDGGSGGEPVAEDGRGGVVGEVAGEGKGAVAEERPPVELDGVGVDNYDTVGGKFIAQPRGEAGVFFDEEELVAAFEQRGGEGTEAGADFDGEGRAVGDRGGGDGAGQVLVVEEILSETFGRTKLQLVEGGADVGEAQEEGSLQFSVFSFQREGGREKKAEI